MLVKSFEISDYKCFRKETKFDSPLLVNLIIGKNNSGKSSFLDVINHIYGSHKLTTRAKINCYCEVEEGDLSSITPVFEPIRKPGNLVYRTNGTLNKKELIGVTIKASVDGRLSNQDVEHNYFVDSNNDRYRLPSGLASSHYSSLTNSNRKTVIMKAERNVVSERGISTVEVSPDGSGLTSALRFHFSDSKGSRPLLESIKDELNRILEGEESFSALRVLNEGSQSTIYLQNEFGEISLNDMGSGIKTILLVLYHLKNEELEPSDTIFMFEEIENNLHPEIQRRLFNTIYDFAIKNKKRIFITSHSHVAINCFYGKPETRIFHIEKSLDGSSNIETIDSDLSKEAILDDLGVKASDLFQTNGIIWVEGPSDRVYINKWLKLVSPDLKEGVDFTYLLYGGKLLASYTANQENDLVDILLTNRNSAIVIDSDIKQEGDSINSTKQRIVDEFKNRGKFNWVTKGREIENYINEDVVNNKYRKDSEVKYGPIGQYEDFKDYIKSDDSTFESHKVQTAKELEFTSDSLGILDLQEKISELASAIRKWNK